MGETNGSDKKTEKTLGMVLIALVLIFSFVNNIPWPSKGEVSEIRDDLKEVKTRLGNIERLLMTRENPRRP